MHTSKETRAEEFINDEEILSVIKYAREHSADAALCEQILAEAESMRGLNAQQAAVLLINNDENINKQIFALAQKIKLEIYGRRIVMFAPLYLSNYCVNGCVYCPYHGENAHIARKQLTQEEIAREVAALQDMGHKRLALETGEDPVRCGIDYVLESIKTVYGVKSKNGSIRRVNVNIAATTIENYAKLKDAGIGTYILFQETYHKPTYTVVHPRGPKSDYAYHTEAMDRAMQGGIDDVGIGALFGLYDYRYDFTGLLLHARHLEDAYGCGPHTISVPRIRPADNVSVSQFPHAVDDDAFEKIIAVLRIAVPYTGIIISTRESVESRKRALEAGVSQISGGSRTSVGGYCEEEKENSAQFEVNDTRTLNEVIKWMCQENYVPSFCTACYRAGRTGDRFMSFAKTGQIKNFCQANALLTFKEYLEDYADDEARALGKNVIDNEIERIPNAEIKNKVRQMLTEEESGRRDFRF